MQKQGIILSRKNKKKNKKKQTLFAKEHDVSAIKYVAFLKKINSIRYLHLK